MPLLNQGLSVSKSSDSVDKKSRIRTDSHKRPHTGSDTHRDLVMLVPSLSLFVPLKYLVFTSSFRHLLLNPSWQLLATFDLVTAHGEPVLC